MTRSGYAGAAGRVVTRGGAGVALFAAGLAVLAAWAVEVPPGRVTVVAAVLGLVALPAVVVGPLVLCDRWCGLRCPRCRGSVTLGCPQAVVLRSGKCTRCQEALFPAAGVETRSG